ncbi:Putative copper export protein [Bacillus sp. OV166]|uniref:multicopper oxidase domain-containing protein n=1 Tax=Bacillus sp. OV166 TaxID=1882763 RepID=UPI000A2AEBFD|nr:multicopper oxidase domain-containing protein [Bacillus sp. OV166]SMQ76554.1 Putative copper export protein [Bacillus sp. OV166]
MGYIIPITEFGHYLLFSILVGHVVLLFIPETRKPKIHISKPLLLLCPLGIILFTFAPLLQVILYFNNSGGFLSAVLTVLTDFEIGRAWIFICILAVLLWITIYVNGSRFFRAQWLLLMIFAIGNASHVASIDFWPGVFSHSIHFLVVSVWVGVLLHVGWFSSNRENWSSFLRWFTPLAIGCFVVIIITGFMIMFVVVNKEQYLNSWQVPYGRMLLIKHISIIPVLTFAFLNGFLSRKTVKLPSFNPRPWIKAESLTLLIVFYCTGVLGTLPPPHEVDATQTLAANPTWLEWLLAKNTFISGQVELVPTISSALLIVISLLFLFLILISYKLMSHTLAIVFGTCFIITIYLGLMFAVNLDTENFTAINKVASNSIESDDQIHIPIPIHTSSKNVATIDSSHSSSNLENQSSKTNANNSNIILTNETMNLNNQCSKNAPVRKFTIAAINVDMVYNKFGDHHPSAKVYALKEDVAKIQQSIEANPGKPVKELQPLTLRANKGDCIEVTFSNQLTEKASIHIDGVGYDVQTSDGTVVGYNSNSTAVPNAEIIYRWNTEEEGTFFFYNGADLTFYTDPTGGKGTMGDGLFGALIVEPIGAKWTDPQTGGELSSGLYANIELPNQPDFREFALFFHDGVEALGKNQPVGTEPPHTDGEPADNEENPADGGKDPADPENDQYGVEKELYAVNYRAEPLDERMENAITEDGKDPTMFYSSWVYGDPATPITPAYVGDPVRFRIIGANEEENHVFHLHGHRWKSDTKKTNTVDSETLNIGSSQTAELTNDAGYIQNGKGAPGDYLWHCHLFPHYLQGMWGLLRVFDKLQPDLLPLMDRQPLAEPTKQNPGFPNYIPGEQGKRAPKPPDPELRPATEKEKEALGALVPGAPNFDRCPKTAQVRKYNVVGIQTDIVYNTEGDHDKDGRMFVLAEDEAKILNGTLRPRPLVIRANEGDCVEVTLENHLFNADEPNALSMHIHYVGFDPLGSDGTAVGWNYNQGTEPGEKYATAGLRMKKGTSSSTTICQQEKKAFMVLLGR